MKEPLFDETLEVARGEDVGIGLVDRMDWGDVDAENVGERDVSDVANTVGDSGGVEEAVVSDINWEAVGVADAVPKGLNPCTDVRREAGDVGKRRSRPEVNGGYSVTIVKSNNLGNEDDGGLIVLHGDRPVDTGEVKRDVGAVIGAGNLGRVNRCRTELQRLSDPGREDADEERDGVGGRGHNRRRVVDVIAEATGDDRVVVTVEGSGRRSNGADGAVRGVEECKTGASTGEVVLDAVKSRSRGTTVENGGCASSMKIRRVLELVEGRIASTECGGSVAEIRHGKREGGRRRQRRWKEGDNLSKDSTLCARGWNAEEPAKGAISQATRNRSPPKDSNANLRSKILAERNRNMCRSPEYDPRKEKNVLRR